VFSEADGIEEIALGEDIPGGVPGEVEFLVPVANSQEVLGESLCVFGGE
jgi:hypothetical protein